MTRNKRRHHRKEIGNNRLFLLVLHLQSAKTLVPANSDFTQAVCILITSFQEWLETIAQRGPPSVARG